MAAPRRGRLGHQPHHFPDDALEELLIRAGLRPRHSSLGGVNEHQIDVARVIQLLPAELPEGEYGDRRPFAAGAARRPALGLETGNGQPQARLDDAIGDPGDLSRHRFQRLLPDEVAIGNPQHLAALEAAHGEHRPFRLPVPGKRSLERGPERLHRLRLPLAKADVLPRGRVGDDDIGQMRPGREDPQQGLEGTGVALEERRCGERATDGSEEPPQRRQHPIGIGDRRKKRGKPGAEVIEEVERDPLLGDAAEQSARVFGLEEATGPSPGRGRGIVVEELAGIDRRRGSRLPGSRQWLSAGGGHLTAPAAARSGGRAPGHRTHRCRTSRRWPAATERLRRDRRRRCRRATKHRRHR